MESIRWWKFRLNKLRHVISKWNICRSLLMELLGGHDRKGHFFKFGMKIMPLEVAPSWCILTIPTWRPWEFMWRNNTSTEWWILGSIMGPDVSWRGSSLLLVSVFILTNGSLAHCIELWSIPYKPLPHLSFAVITWDGTYHMHLRNRSRISKKQTISALFSVS